MYYLLENKKIVNMNEEELNSIYYDPYSDEEVLNPSEKEIDGFFYELVGQFFVDGNKRYFIKESSENKFDLIKCNDLICMGVNVYQVRNENEIGLYIDYKGNKMSIKQEHLKFVIDKIYKLDNEDNYVLSWKK